MATINDKLKGYIYVLASALLYGSMSVMAKAAYSTGLNPNNVLWMRYAFSLLPLIIYLRLFKGRQSIMLRPIVILQGMLFIAGGLLIFYSLQHMSAGLTIVILFTYPLWVTLMARFFFKEKLDARLMLAMLCAMGGIAMISFSGQSTTFTITGAVLAFGASLTYSCYTLIGQKTVQYGDTLVLINSFFLVGTILIVLIYPSDVAYLARASLVQIAIGIFMALFNTILPVLFHLNGVEKIGASRAGFAGTAEPVFVIILAAMFLGEHLSLVQLAGSALVLASLLFIVHPNAPHE